MLIVIPNNDSTIIGRDEVIIKLTTAMIHQELKINISLNGEGPCVNSLGLYNLLDTLCDRFNYNKNQIYIETANLLEQHPEYVIIKTPQLMYLNRTKKLEVDTSKHFDSNFKTFGHFIGHSNLPRLQLASFLHANYSEKTLQSYHCCVTEPYHREHIGLEDLLFNGATSEEFSWAKKLIEDSPLVLDQIDSYPILMPDTLNITKVYPNFFIELASITYFSGTTFYIDEKIWRPMLMKTPFMVQGSADFIPNLKRLGFKTFDHWWDEGYSQDPVNCQVLGIIDNVKQLSTLTVDQLKDMYEEMLPTLEHNYNRFMTLTKNDFMQAFTL
jgi:hypothetical protein